MTRNYSTTFLAFIVMTFILLSFPSQVRSQDSKAPVIMAQVGAGVIGAVKNSPDEYADDEFNEDLWGDSAQQDEAYASDPWQGYNRAMFNFNDGLYFNVMKPVTQGYMYAVPLKPRTWINNAFQNLLRSIIKPVQMCCICF